MEDGASPEAPAEIVCCRARAADGAGAYAIRVGAPEAAMVEVSIDHGPWEPCRPAAGFWWPETDGALSGRHHVRAQLLRADGRLMGVASRRVGPAPEAA